MKKTTDTEKPAFELSSFPWLFSVNRRKNTPGKPQAHNSIIDSASPNISPIFKQSIFCGEKLKAKRKRNQNDQIQLLLRNKKSQFQYLKNINCQDRWLKMALVSYAFCWSCGLSEEDSLRHAVELKSFEQFELFTLVFALVYLRRLDFEESLSIANFIKLYFSCCLIALKYQEDYTILNARYTETISADLKELNLAEANIVAKLSYKLDVDYPEIILLINDRIKYLKLVDLIA